MDNIFNYNPTQEEILDVLGVDIPEKEYTNSFDQSTFTHHLCFLFFKRNEMDLYEQKLNLLSDQEQLDMERTVYHT